MHLNRFLFVDGTYGKVFLLNWYVIPIKKDKKSSINAIDNLRSISTSKILAQIFERVLSNKMNEINKSHENQFGYKNKTSCT